MFGEHDIPPSAIGAFAGALGTAWLLVLTQHWHGRFSMDGTSGIQKAHQTPTPRVGGVAIVLGVLVAYWVARPERQAILGPLLFAGLPAFAFGLAEDITKRVSVLSRLLATMLSGVVGWFITGYSLTGLGVPGLDGLLMITGFSVRFTAFAIGGVANAVNIVDGLNGLASGVVAIAMLGLTAISLQLGDVNLAFACLALGGAMLGFFVFNWPLGKLFLGDGGSYFAGFALAWACVLLVERNASVTPFAALLLCIHPVFEVLFSMFRRHFRQQHPGHPDRLHLHSLLLRRVVSRWRLSRRVANSVAGVLVAGLTAPAAVAAWALHNNAALSVWACVLFCLGYLTVYARLVRFRWCSPVAFFMPRQRRA